MSYAYGDSFSGIPFENFIQVVCYVSLHDGKITMPGIFCMRSLGKEE